jgi:hypothetical protein
VEDWVIAKSRDLAAPFVSTSEVLRRHCQAHTAGHEVTRACCFVLEDSFEERIV